MSLLGLLARGRSFERVRRRSPAYELTEGWLPDFGRRQERVLGDVGGHDTVLAASSWPERDLGTGASAGSEFFEVRAGLSAARVGPGGEAGAARLAARPTPTPAPKLEAVKPSGAAGGTGAAVQGELSLESVRVVRNDLASDDLELIPRWSQPVRLERTSRPGKGRAAGGGWRGWLAHWLWFFRRRAW